MMGIASLNPSYELTIRAGHETLHPTSGLTGSLEWQIA
jgi:hypothetical protein